MAQLPVARADVLQPDAQPYFQEAGGVDVANLSMFSEPEPTDASALGCLPAQLLTAGGATLTHPPWLAKVPHSATWTHGTNSPRAWELGEMGTEQRDACKERGRKKR